MRAATRLLAALACSTCFATSAGAEPPGEAGHSWLRFDLGFGKLRQNGTDFTLIDLGLGGGVWLGRDLTLEGTLPIALARSGDSATSLGNLTAILSYVLRDGAGLSWIAGSLSLPTASTDGNGQLAAATNALFWFADPGLYAPSTTTYRLGGHHAVLRPSQYFEAGLEAQYLAIDKASDQLHLVLDLEGGVHLSDRLVGFLGLANVWNASAASGQEELFHALRAGFQLAARPESRARAYLYYPLDASYRDARETLGLVLSIEHGF